MTINPRRYLITCGFACLALAFAILGSSSNSRAFQTTEVLSQQDVQIEDMRSIGLSPDGNLFAATIDRQTLCVYDVPTFSEVACADLTPLEATLRLADVSWSPDSSRLVLTENSFMLYRDGDLWVMDAFTGELTNMTDDGFNGNLTLLSDGETAGATIWLDVSPAWSPDGASISFSRSVLVDGEFTGNSIVTVPADGGEAEVLIEVTQQEPGVVYFPMRWSADGSSLYYSVAHMDRDDPSNGLYRYDAASGNTEMIISATPEQGTPGILQVSPAGDKLLVNFPVLASAFGADEPLYWLYDLEGGELAPVTQPGANDYPASFLAAATFSPDGASLLVGMRTTSKAQLWEIDLASGEAALLVDDLPGVLVAEWTLQPTWTASGRVFVGTDFGSGVLLEVPPRQASTAAESVATPSPVAAASFESGDRALVISNGVPLFSAPSGLAPAVLLLDAGDFLTVLGPPEEAEGALWLPVQETETRTIGFVRVELVVKA